MCGSHINSLDDAYNEGYRAGVADALAADEAPDLSAYDELADRLAEEES